MGRTVDIDQLIDSHGVADVLGLAQHQSVSLYRRRYDTFPEPLLTAGSGRCLLWHRADIEAWAEGRRSARSR